MDVKWEVSSYHRSHRLGVKYAIYCPLKQYFHILVDPHKSAPHLWRTITSRLWDKYVTDSPPRSFFVPKVS
jgi:hypothetical protein